MLHPPGGGDRIPYTRISTMAKWVDSKEGLVNWTASQALVGLMKSKSLQARVASLSAKHENPYDSAKGELKTLVDTATQLAQSQGKADYGTAVHEFSEMIDSGDLDWSYVPESLKGPLEAYKTVMQGIKVLDTEVFVTVDDEVDGEPITAAGSMDRIVHHPQLGIVVADLKTGAKEPSYPLGVTTQVALYSRGRRYRDAKFDGTPAFEDGTPNVDKTAWRKPLWPIMSTTAGLMIHVPLQPVKGKFVADLYHLDLTKGWECLQLGVRVNRARKMPKLEKITGK